MPVIQYKRFSVVRVLSRIPVCWTRALRKVLLFRPRAAGPARGRARRPAAEQSPPHLALSQIPPPVPQLTRCIPLLLDANGRRKPHEDYIYNMASTRGAPVFSHPTAPRTATGRLDCQNYARRSLRLPRGS